MQAINRHLFEELGYAGNHDEYYDPRNSYLNEVFERRLGNPISLAMVQIEVARRLGVPLDGVSFPGHFLVRLPVDDGVLVMDPFNRGRPLGRRRTARSARVRTWAATSPTTTRCTRSCNPASHRAILMRMLRNLHGVYSRARGLGARGAQRRPDPQAVARQRRRAARPRPGATSNSATAMARARISARYLQRNPSAPDAASVRERLVELGSSGARPS